ncbi:MAG: cytidylate kinase-like family protein [Pseudomonadota bacterium]
MAILTISRQLGSGIREIRLEIAAALNYSYVDKRCILEEIRERGEKWEKWAMEFDESSPSMWEKYDWSFKGFGALLQSVMLSHCINDNVILAGRGSNFLLEGIPHAYRVRFVAPMEQRIQRIAVWESVDLKTAQSLAKKRDRERAGFVHALYGKDMNRSEFYDAVFDTGVTPADKIIDIVKETLLEKDKLKTEKTQDLLRIRAAAATVRAALMTDIRLYVPTLEVLCDETEVVIRGIVRNAGQYSKIVEAARYFAEDVPLKVELRFRL